MNGLGTVIKTLTGNLDDNDGQRINQIIENLHLKQNTLQKQLEMQYTLNSNTIDKFNQTLNNVQHNELILKSRIMQLTTIIEQEIQLPNVLFTKDLYNQLIIFYNSILSILQEIENSLTFCALHTFHPSILKASELYTELEKISLYYEEQLPYELKFENLPDFQKLIQVNCKIDKNKIIYFLSLPINFETNFDLFYLMSIPSKTTEGYVTLLPNYRYFLKSKDIVKSLNNQCTPGKVFQCSSFTINNNGDPCGKEILQNEEANHCQHLKLDIPENHLEIVSEINQYLAVFSSEENIKFQCAKETEIKKLLGVFLIEDSECDLIFRNEKIKFIQKSLGKPFILNNVHINSSTINVPKSKMVLKNLQLDSINLHQIEPVEKDSPPPSNFKFSVFLFYFIISILGWMTHLGLVKLKQITSLRKINITNSNVADDHQHPVSDGQNLPTSISPIFHT